jgi:1-acyl-sn-glycerol-3-phosphate acyltransferase
MFTTGLKKFETSDTQTFTTDAGMKFRKWFNPIWRHLLTLGTARKVIVEQYPHLDPKKNYIFVANHSFDEDAISLLSTIDRNVYLLHGTTDQLEHNPVFLAVWLNGMIYVNRLNAESRHMAVEKMERVLKAGNSILLFPEGGYNNTENLLITPLFSSPYILNCKLGVEIVPIISFCPYGSKKIYIRAGDPMSVSHLDKVEAMAQIRDVMSTIVWDMIENHTEPVKRSTLPADCRTAFMEWRKQIYESQKWHSDVWDEELTQYSGHGVTQPQAAGKYVDQVHIDSKNAWVFSELLVRREEDKKYDLKQYLRKSLKLSR